MGFPLLLSNPVLSQYAKPSTCIILFSSLGRRPSISLPSPSLVDKQDVVVNGLGYPHNTTVDFVLLAHLVDRIGSSVASVAPDHKEHVNAPHVDSFHNLPRVQRERQEREGG